MFLSIMDIIYKKQPEELDSLISLLRVNGFLFSYLLIFEKMYFSSSTIKNTIIPAESG